MLVPLVLVILAFAVYPQQALDNSEAAVAARRRRAGAGGEAVAQKGATP